MTDQDARVAARRRGCAGRRCAWPSDVSPRPTSSRRRPLAGAAIMPAAVRHWRPLADRGDADAQFNLGQAYKLGRGVPRNMTSPSWYENAARQGHEQAQANARPDPVPERPPPRGDAVDRRGRRARRPARAICIGHRLVQRRPRRQGLAARLCADERAPPTAGCRRPPTISRRWSASSAPRTSARGAELARSLQSARRRCRSQRRARRPAPRRSP